MPIRHESQLCQTNSESRFSFVLASGATTNSTDVTLRRQYERPDPHEEYMKCHVLTKFWRRLFDPACSIAFCIARVLKPQHMSIGFFFFISCALFKFCAKPLATSFPGFSPTRPTERRASRREPWERIWTAGCDITTRRVLNKVLYEDGLSWGTIPYPFVYYLRSFSERYLFKFVYLPLTNGYI